MSLSTITITGQTVTLVALPFTSGSMRTVEWDYSDAVAIVRSPFTGQTQRQQWPGADMISGTMELPLLVPADLCLWEAALKECRGRANAFLLGDPAKTTPRGTVLGVPQIDNSVSGSNQAGSQVLSTKGWTATETGLLLPGDYLQIGYRLHTVLDSVSSDGTGKASIAIWPSLREVPTDGGAIITTNPVGLFARSENKFTIGAAATQGGKRSLSFRIEEYR